MEKLQKYLYLLVTLTPDSPKADFLCIVYVISDLFFLFYLFYSILDFCST